MNTDFKTNIYRSKHVILKLLSFQQNDNELTVPRLSFFLQRKLISIGHSVHWTQYVSEETVIAALYKKEQNNLLDYHQRVPTQIDRFILLKSFAFSALARQRGAYNTLPTLKVNIKL